MAERRRVRVLLVDDYPIVRSGLRALLAAEDDIEVVGEAGDAREAIFETRTLNPDVILLDVVMPGESGLEVLPKLRHEAPDARVLVLSIQDDSRDVREAFSAGASGYVLKEAAADEIVQAVRDVAAGGSYVQSVLGARMVAAEMHARAEADADPLSPREHEVLRLLALGHTNEELGKLLFISVRTVESHRRNLMQKLRLFTRAELVGYAVQHELLHESEEP